MPESPTLRRVLGGQLCSGCGLCAGISHGAIEMAVTPPGYARPRQLAPLSEDQEAKVADGCPGSKVEPWDTPLPTDVYWGPYQQVATGNAVDAKTRFQGSSGGALTAFAIQALADGTVDAVIHVGADPDRPARNLTRVSRTAAEVLDGAGSRYSSSSPLEAIDQLLATGERYLFIGKPCDVSALRRLARSDARVDTQIPLKLSFFCGGIPSHAGANRIIAAMGIDPATVRQFRYRGFGWPGRATATAHDGAAGDMSYADSWGGHLSKEVQFRCKICPDAVGGVADIAAADAWYGGDTGYPQFEERDGRSLIVIRSDAGQGLLTRCLEEGSVAAEPLGVREIDLMQPSQANRKRLITARIAACRTLLQPVPDMRGLRLPAAARLARLRDHARNYLGTMRRIVQNRR